MIFEDNNNIYFIEKSKGESIEYYSIKSKFISRCNPKNISEFNYYKKFASIYCNIHILKCKYNKNINIILDTIIKSKNIDIF